MNRNGRVGSLPMTLVVAQAIGLSSRRALADDDNGVTIAGTVLTVLGAAGGVGTVGCAVSHLAMAPPNTCIGVTAGVGAFLVVIGGPMIILGTHGAEIIHAERTDPLRGVGLSVGGDFGMLTWLKHW